ncbi:hypothetical protein GCM10010399_52080 [Dactylosporangium fulvum]
MAGAVEVYVEHVLEHLFIEAPLPTDPTQLAQFQRATSQPPRTWADLKSRYSDFHGIDLSTIADWSRFEACLTVRNTIAHGLGRFTMHQLAKELSQQVSLVGISVRDGCPIVDQQALGTCFTICRNVVRDLDLRV